MVLYNKESVNLPEFSEKIKNIFLERPLTTIKAPYPFPILSQSKDTGIRKKYAIAGYYESFDKAAVTIDEDNGKLVLSYGELQKIRIT